MLVEPLVLDCDDRLLDGLRDVLGRDEDAAIVARQRGELLPVSIDDDRVCAFLYCWRFSSAGRSWATDIITPKNHEMIASTPSPITTNARRSSEPRAAAAPGWWGTGRRGRLGVPRHGGLTGRRSRGAVVTPSPSRSLSARTLSPAYAAWNPSSCRERVRGSPWKRRSRSPPASGRSTGAGSRPSTARARPRRSTRRARLRRRRRGRTEREGNARRRVPNRRTRRAALRRSLAISLRRVAMFECAGVKRGVRDGRAPGDWSASPDGGLAPIHPGETHGHPCPAERERQSSTSDDGFAAPGGRSRRPARSRSSRTEGWRSSSSTVTQRRSLGSTRRRRISISATWQCSTSCARSRTRVTPSS